MWECCQGRVTGAGHTECLRAPLLLWEPCVWHLSPCRVGEGLAVQGRRGRVTRVPLAFGGRWFHDFLCLIPEAPPIPQPRLLWETRLAPRPWAWSPSSGHL